jgi:hypothetical protein
MLSMSSFLQNVLWRREMKAGKNQQINSKTRARSNFREYLEIGEFAATSEEKLELITDRLRRYA